MSASSRSMEGQVSPRTPNTTLGSSSQTSPFSSIMTTTPGPSPEMPKHIHADVMANLPAHARQLNPPRTPMYVPAVLRPTERPVRQFPPTPPQSNNASVDSLDTLDARQLIRVSTDSSSRKKFSLGRVAEDEWISEEGMGRVTGPPGKDHWKPDHSSTSCDAATCTKIFSIIERRHHCRRCGNIFCNEHSSYTIPLNQQALFHTDGMFCRVCDTCWTEYKVWDNLRCSRSNSDTSQLSTQTPTTPVMGIGSPAGSRSEGDESARVGSYAQSVPRDWTWSTF